MNAIFAKILYELEKSHNLVLVSIVSQEGSSPRGVGAQMLVGEHGRILGTVGGGSVEMHCEQNAFDYLKGKQSGKKVFFLKTGDKDDIGMVCGGDIEVWFQYVDSSLSFWRQLAGTLLNLLANHQGGWLALNTDGSLPAILDSEGIVVLGALPTGASVPSLLHNKYLKTKNSFFMPLPVRERAVIFGGGHCTQALVPMLNKVGFRVAVMDNRREFARPELFPDAESVVCGDFKRIADYIQLSISDYIVIMTSGHSYDLDVQQQVLKNPPVYVGVIGSKSKKAFVNQRLKEAGFLDEVIQNVHSPIGTEIKAVTPEEIAISITGEMIYERALLREACGIITHGCPMH
ncbi:MULTISPECIES: XdhC family protein [unclassified Sedimentibacter]|uniref:XdhC family protein n=1 Tax=unclassified Sedimentibacter TaxID=2649220 RepID=UPI0027E00AB8|nr:XdhC/CoxI family protein [Sedimentibacter sp. MB35-C1]WMJ78058.1 XdhC family protein [Sedimentibacter sp. MB35-C1]